MNTSQKKLRVYLGIDVGGTKIQVSAINEAGVILAGCRAETPRDVAPGEVIDAITATIDETLGKIGPRNVARLRGIGMAIPGVVDSRAGLIVKTPNMNLSGIAISGELEQRFGVPVFLGNDCNLGALGEVWLGSARGARSAVVMLVGTGIGGGVVRKGRILRGAREVAGEVGHMILDVGAVIDGRGPVCGCGSRGCFETMASRTAIERQIREAVAAGEKTILTETPGAELSLIKSGALRNALTAGDPLVTRVIRRAAQVLGYGCLTIRHLLDPEVIVLGGGVIVACADWMMPVIEEIVAGDPMPGARPDRGVLISALGDDAVVYGGVALAMTRTRRYRLHAGPAKRGDGKGNGKKNMEKRSSTPVPVMPVLVWGTCASGRDCGTKYDCVNSNVVKLDNGVAPRLWIDGKPINVDVILSPDGNVKKLKGRKKSKKNNEKADGNVPGTETESGVVEMASSEIDGSGSDSMSESSGERDPLGEKSLRRACGGGPEIVFLGTGESGDYPIPDSVIRYFSQRAIRTIVLPTPALVEEFNRTHVRRAAIIPQRGEKSDHNILGIGKNRVV